MEPIKIKHVALECNWNNESIFKNAKTLVLGSFNPFNPKNENADYYYGRKANYFWKILAQLMGKPDHYFFQNQKRKNEAMLNFEFCFQDIIDEISIEIKEETGKSDDDIKHVRDFIDNNIFKDYSDQILFLSNSKKFNVKITRVYNNKVIELLKSLDFHTTMHTMGNDRITKQLRVKPIEKKLLKLGFDGYMKEVVTLSKQFVTTSYSPSQIAVNQAKNTKEYKSDLRYWIGKHIIGY